MAKLKFPYTMHCPRCKAPLKIKSEKLIGQRLPCPKCKKSIDVVTPDEDGSIPYVVEAMPEPEPDPEPTEEELEAKRLDQLKAKRKRQWQAAKHWASVFWLTAVLAGCSWLCYKYIYVEGYLKEAEDKMGEDPATKYKPPR